MHAFKLDLYPANLSQEYAPKLHFGIKNYSPNDLDCREKPAWHSCWLLTLEHLTTATWFLSPPPTLNPYIWVHVVSGQRRSTCILWGADTVAVALFVHRSSGTRSGESPVSGQGVWGAGGVWPVQSPLAGVSAPCCGRTSFGSASGSGI